MEDRAKNDNNFCIFVPHTVVLNNAGLNLLVNEYAKQPERKVGNDFHVGWTVVSVAHAFNSHYVGALPECLQPLVFFDLVDYVFQLGVAMERYVKNV